MQMHLRNPDSYDFARASDTFAWAGTPQGQDKSHWIKTFGIPASLVRSAMAAEAVEEQGEAAGKAGGEGKASDKAENKCVV